MRESDLKGVSRRRTTTTQQGTERRPTPGLVEHDLTKAMFAEIGALLQEKGLLLKQGTIVDARSSRRRVRRRTRAAAATLRCARRRRATNGTLE